MPIINVELMRHVVTSPMIAATRSKIRLRGMTSVEMEWVYYAYSMVLNHPERPELMDLVFTKSFKANGSIFLPPGASVYGDTDFERLLCMRVAIGEVMTFEGAVIEQVPVTELEHHLNADENLVRQHGGPIVVGTDGLVAAIHEISAHRWRPEVPEVGGHPFAMDIWDGLYVNEDPTSQEFGMFTERLATARPVEDFDEAQLAALLAQLR